MKKRLIAIAIIVFFPSISLAESYDFYVSKDGTSGGDGSQKKPFREVEKAIKEAKSRSSSSRKIYIGKGTYNENLALSDSIKLYGDNKGTVISGEIRMGDNALLKGITVSNGAVNVTVEKNADAVIENCTIKNADTIGIETLAGGGTLTVKNSDISDNKTKGFYIQDGKKLYITGNSISKNKEEGIDIRAYTSGVISGNSIYSNGEGGIEIVAGGSKMEINNNTSKNNKASGIAIQFYAASNKSGQVQASNNKLTGNGKYGIDCVSPHEKNSNPLFFQNSITLSSNTWQGNVLGNINSICHIKEPGNEDKAGNLSPVQEPVSRKDEAAAEAQRLKEEEEKRLEEERKLAEEKRKKQEEIKILINDQLEIEKMISQNIEVLAKKNKVAVFFAGVDKEKLINTQEKISNSQMKIQKIREMKSSGENPEEISAFIEAQEKLVSEQGEFIKKQFSRFSLWGWFSGLLDFF